MNPKIEKINGDIEKVKGKMSALQTQLRDLERKKTEIENAEIVAIFRKEKLSEDDLAALVRQMSERSVSERGIASGSQDQKTEVKTQ